MFGILDRRSARFDPRFRWAPGGSVGISSKTLSFTINNSGRIGGIAFTATFATSITFTLDIGGHPATAAQVYLGSPPAHSTSPSPLTFTR